MVQVALYSNRMEAELAQAGLSAAGIESFLKMDDTGGMMTVFQHNRGVGVLVAEEDEKEAREVLETSARPEDPETE